MVKWVVKSSHLKTLKTTGEIDVCSSSVICLYCGGGGWGGWMGGWVGGWMGGWVGGWMGGWVDNEEKDE